MNELKSSTKVLALSAALMIRALSSLFFGLVLAAGAGLFLLFLVFAIASVGAQCGFLRLKGFR